MTFHRIMTTQDFSDSLDKPESFHGGAIVTNKGKAELFVCTAEERLLEVYEWKRLQHSLALAKLVFAAREDVRDGNVVNAKAIHSTF